MLGDFKSDLFTWISTILDHWGSLATGGVLVALITLLKENHRLREKYPQFFTWSTARWITASFLLFAMFQSWQQEYRSRVGRETDLRNSNHASDLLRQDLRFQAQQIGARCDAKDQVNQTLQAQNRGQQASINSCLSQAMKLLVPVQQKTTPVFLDRGDSENAAMRKMRWLVLTNKPMTPVHLNAVCTSGVSYMDSADASVLGNTSLRFAGGNNRLAPNAWELRDSGTWSPEAPLLVTINYMGLEQVVCSFIPR
jgi:hypothetical protein